MHGIQRNTQPLTTEEYNKRTEKINKYIKVTQIFGTHRNEAMIILKKLIELTTTTTTITASATATPSSSTATSLSTTTLITDPTTYTRIVALQSSEAIELRKQLETLYTVDEKITASLIEINPDYYSLWNYRREMFLYYWAKIDDDVRQKKSEQPQSIPVTDTDADATDANAIAPTTNQSTTATTDTQTNELIRQKRTELCSANLNIAERGVRKNIKWYVDCVSSLVMIRLSPVYLL
jgi:hypothetical protein